MVEFGQIDDCFDDPLSCFLIQIHQEFDHKIFLFLGRIGGHEDRREVPWFAVEVSPSLFMVCERGAKPFPHVFDVPGHRAFANPALGGERGAAWEPAPSDLQVELEDAGDLGFIHGVPPGFGVVGDF